MGDDRTRQRLLRWTNCLKKSSPANHAAWVSARRSNAKIFGRKIDPCKSHDIHGQSPVNRETSVSPAKGTSATHERFPSSTRTAHANGLSLSELARGRPTPKVSRSIYGEVLITARGSAKWPPTRRPAPRRGHGSSTILSAIAKPGVAPRIVPGRANTRRTPRRMSGAVRMSPRFVRPGTRAPRTCDARPRQSKNVLTCPTADVSMRYRQRRLFQTRSQGSRSLATDINFRDRTNTAGERMGDPDPRRGVLLVTAVSGFSRRSQWRQPVVLCR